MLRRLGHGRYGRWAARLLLLCATGCVRAPYFEQGSHGGRPFPVEPKEVFVVFRDGERTRATLLEVRTQPETLLVLVRRDVDLISRPETLEVPLSDIERVRPPDRTSGSYAGMFVFLLLIGGLAAVAIALSGLGGIGV